MKNYNSSIILRLILLTETFIQTCNHSYTVHLFKSSDTIFFTSLDTFSSTSWTLFLFPLGLTSFFSLSGDRFLIIYFPQFVGLHPTFTTGLIQDAPAWVCQPSSLQHLCLHTPGSTFWSRSRLLPITHAQLITSCPFNLSVGQSCIHFISPLISNYPHQYPKSHNLGFHQHPLHDTKIKPSQLALNSSPPYNQTILSSQSKHHVHN